MSRFTAYFVADNAIMSRFTAYFVAGDDIIMSQQLCVSVCVCVCVCGVYVCAGWRLTDRADFQ